MPPFALLCGLLVLAVGLSYAQQMLASPVLSILNRWVRWGLFSVAFAEGAEGLFESDRPTWLWIATGFLLWPLLETMYSWIAIKDLSLSHRPLFPRYSVNRAGEAWPNQHRFLVLRAWLRQEKFRHVQSLTADLRNGVLLRVSAFHDPDEHIRLLVMFVPQPSGNVAVCYVFSSQTKSGARLVTDNIYLPFGGFYPENWDVERRPWTRLPETLFRHHLRRLAACPELLETLVDEPLHDLNAQQQQLERTNTDLGFLFPRNLQEEYGSLTWEGRYRHWKEAWWLSYFGRPGRY